MDLLRRPPLLVPEKFNTEPDENGDILMHVDGDRGAPPSGRMPKGGFYFDPIVRQPPLDESKLDPADNMEEFVPLDDAEVSYLGAETERLYRTTDKALVLVLPGMGFGNIALVPGTWLKHPRCIRDFAEWYMSTVIRRDCIRQVLKRQCEVALVNLQKIYAAVGNRPTVAWVSGTDFGAQDACLVAPTAFRTLYKPFYRVVNDWIHEHTTWKTFIRTCGSIQPRLPEIVEAGFDIRNPVQASAANMDPAELKARWGDEFTFWGGGIDTQHVLPFESPAEVRKQVRERLRIFGPGGFVFSPVHNVQAGVPVQNLIAMYETVAEYGGIPLGRADKRRRSKRVSQIETIYTAVLGGDATGAKAGVQATLEAGAPAETILKEGLIAAMAEVGRLFEANEYFVPEMLVAARAMQQALGLLKPHLVDAGASSAGKAVVGTVKGDLQDIGKNLVAMMLEGAGFEVVDLETDVTPGKFLKAVTEHRPNVIGMSALLTTTMPSMGNTIKALEEAGLRDQVKVMVGGAPVTDDFAKKIGADDYSPDPSSAVRLAKSLVG